jgi:hypothetical protein
VSRNLSRGASDFNFAITIKQSIAETEHPNPPRSHYRNTTRVKRLACIPLRIFFNLLIYGPSTISLHHFTLCNPQQLQESSSSLSSGCRYYNYLCLVLCINSLSISAFFHTFVAVCKQSKTSLHHLDLHKIAPYPLRPSSAL